MHIKPIKPNELKWIDEYDDKGKGLIIVNSTLLTDTVVIAYRYK